MKYFVLIFLYSCGGVATVEYADKNEHSICDYSVDEICVIDKWGANIDIVLLSNTISKLEIETNVFYPLDLLKMIGNNKLSVEFRWATFNTGSLKGNFEPPNHILVYLRNGDNINDQMKCMDRYFIFSHEMLHFISYCLGYMLDNPHNIPHIFREWARINCVPDDTVEQMMYEYTRFLCR